ncbi:MAG: DUF4188 domain-containing protein [Alphaproteobacteria bacterium]|nr:DUF4188 domain-containing protein [Alphaproteobacteria bacterium]MCB9697432.1 DUF4188 domain-containing protein [Alphaproteobacteria bacterium]
MLPSRLTVSPDERFVVFLIGMRVNRPWMVPAIWAIAAGMQRMLGELERNPEAGLLRAESWFGRTTISVQYWRSEEHLLAYAHDKEREHTSTWAAWSKRLGLDGAIGIWHETYVVSPGGYECVYVHMPPFGLGGALPRVPADGPLSTARRRLTAAAPERRVAAS